MAEERDPFQSPDRAVGTNVHGLTDVKVISDFSMAGEVVPMAETPTYNREPVRPLDRHQQFASDMSAALDVLSPSEQHRLMTVLKQADTRGCVEALWTLCTSSHLDHIQYGSGPPQDENHHQDVNAEDCRGSSSRCRQQEASPECLQPDAAGPGTDIVEAVPEQYLPCYTEVDTTKQPPVSLMHENQKASAPKRRPKKPTKRRLLCDNLEYGQPDCDFDSLGSEQTMPAKKKKSPKSTVPVPLVRSEVGEAPGEETAAPQAQSSTRNRVWDLLYDVEKQLLMSDRMTAAEGVKRLLGRRAAALGCEIKEIDELDGWGIGLKLKADMSHSEPLTEPRTCCLCSREGVVFSKHNYYCRRCQLIYRALHRKKQALGV